MKRVMKHFPITILIVLLGSSWIFATQLNAPRTGLPSADKPATGGFAMLLGDSRRLLAKHFFTKADVYFHSGYYPSVFDQALRRQANESPAPGGRPGEERCESDFSSKPRDWIDAFGRKFYPSQHTHLGEGPDGAGKEKEILPWLRLSLELSPDDIDTYTLAAYWLDRRLKKPEQAEQVLRDGLAANPGHPELLFELGRVIYGQGKDLSRARNLWESTWRRWQQLEAQGKSPDRMIAERALASLGELEERSGNFPRALEWQTLLKGFSPLPEVIQQNIDRLKNRIAAPPAPTKAP
jgi:tetratricopeptide (TPR) repeat protein